MLLWAIPLRGCDWIPGDTGISSGQQEYYITDCAINRHRKSTIIYIGGDVSAALVRLVSNAITMSSVYPPSCGQRTFPPPAALQKRLETVTANDVECVPKQLVFVVHTVSFISLEVLVAVVQSILTVESYTIIISLQSYLLSHLLLLVFHHPLTLSL